MVSRICLKKDAAPWNLLPLRMSLQKWFEAGCTDVTRYVQQSNADNRAHAWRWMRKNKEGAKEGSKEEKNGFSFPNWRNRISKKDEKAASCFRDVRALLFHPPLGVHRHLETEQGAAVNVLSDVLKCLVPGP